MKLMIRNLLYLFKRFKTAVVLNLFGLTIAFAAFLLIVMQVDYEMITMPCTANQAEPSG